MKKQTLSIGITVLLLCIVFSGCIEENNNGSDSGDVEIVSYTMNTWQMGDLLTGKSSTELSEGFVVSDDADYFSVNAEIKNIGNEIITEVEAKVNFYDENDNYLTSKYETVKNIYVSQTKSFGVSMWKSDSYFKISHHVDFEFNVTKATLDETTNYLSDPDSKIIGRWQREGRETIWEFKENNVAYLGDEKVVFYETENGILYMDWDHEDLNERQNVLYIYEYSFVNSEKIVLEWGDPNSGLSFHDVNLTKIS